ncbi:MAG TPA: alpha/beta family hydrolase [Acidobacteriota bacterium]|nr:alpha/beta family hydrolase [Acidobacteriota bacterium]
MTVDDFIFDGVPDGPTVVLAHGAGAAMDSPWMNNFAAGLAEHRLRVARFEFPYMRRRRETGKRGGPDRASTLLEAWREAVGALGSGSELVIGGKSMGGRIASMVADEVAARGLLCLGYPFHPPGRPDKLRTAHLTDLRTPTLVLQGVRDAFGTPAEVERYGLSAAISVHWLADGDHSFKPRVRSGRTLAGNLQEALDAAAAFVGALPTSG